jgi:hypothetical protein
MEAQVFSKHVQQAYFGMAACVRQQLLLRVLAVQVEHQSPLLLALLLPPVLLQQSRKIIAALVLPRDGVWYRLPAALASTIVREVIREHLLLAQVQLCTMIPSRDVTSLKMLIALVEPEE